MRYIESIEHKEKNKSKRLFKTAFLILGIILGVLISRIFIVPVKLHNDSMEPNFSQGVKLIVSKRVSLSMGDAIVFKSPIQQNKVLFGRIAAAPLETIEIKDKNIFINNKEITLPWKIKSEDLRKFPTTFSFRDNMPQIKLKDEEWFVLCDNMDFGFDSRELGPINKSNIIGKIIYPRKK